MIDAVICEIYFLELVLILSYKLAKSAFCHWKDMFNIKFWCKEKIIK